MREHEHSRYENGNGKEIEQRDHEPLRLVFLLFLREVPDQITEWSFTYP